MIDILNVVAMLATIAFGAIGWLAPRYTLGKVDLHPGGSTMGLSEIRAASGALFVGLGIAGLVVGSPVAFVMVGAAYAGASVGRITSIVLDKARSSTAFGFLAAEVIMAAWLLGANLAL